MISFVFLVFSGVHNMCKILPNSLKTQELNCKSQSQRWSGGVQNFPSIANSRYVHASRCWKRKRGENQLTSRQQKITIHEIRICVDLDHLTQFNQDGAVGGTACTSTRRFTTEAKASSGGTWVLFVDHWEHSGWLNFFKRCLDRTFNFFYWWFCAPGFHFISLCMVLWINMARVVIRYPCGI